MSLQIESTASRWCDAHRHLEGSRRGDIPAVFCSRDPDDWDPIIENSNTHTGSISAIGVHPWYLNNVANGWQETFVRKLPMFSAVGEIGIDSVNTDSTIDEQAQAFKFQLAQAAQADLPVSIHCVRALPKIREIIRTTDLPKRGIHFHSLRASAQEVERLRVGVPLYFSFNYAQLTRGGKQLCEMIRNIPEESLLIESDYSSEHGNAIPYEEQIQGAYTALSKIRGVEPARLERIVLRNFERYFMGIK